MKTGKTILVLLAALLLAAGVAVAQTKPAPAARSEAAAGVKPAAEVGVIKSITDTELVIEVQMGDKKVESTYVLNAQTVRLGNLVPGTKVVVRYNLANDVRTAVKVKPAGLRKGEAKQPQ